MDTILKGFVFCFLIFAATVTNLNAMGTGRIELYFLSFAIWGFTLWLMFRKKKKS